MNHKRDIRSVSILGFGKVGKHIARRCHEKEITIDQIYHRSAGISNWHGVPISTGLHNMLTMSDMYILCVTDDAIGTVSEALGLYLPSSSLVAHTSGRAPLDDISDFFKRRACLYPLQSFSEGQSICWNDVPIIINTEVRRDQMLLERFAKKLSDTVYHYTDSQKNHIHLSAVIANNFTNALVTEAYNYLITHDVDPQILSALLRQTFDKINRIGPYSAQTGPAMRGDQKTIDAHLALLAQTPRLQALYALMTEFIEDQHGRDE